MINRKPIVFAMGVSDMSNTTLYHEISKYKDICMADVDEIIDRGVYGYLIDRYERVVAWILGLKRFFPKGWIPTLRVVRVKEAVDLPKQGRLDLFNTSDNRGDNHYKRKAVLGSTRMFPHNRKDGGKIGRGKPWTPAEHDKLERLYKSGLSLLDIANKLKRTKPAIQTKIARKGFKRCQDQ